MPSYFECLLIREFVLNPLKFEVLKKDIEDNKKL